MRPWPSFGSARFLTSKLAALGSPTTVKGWVRGPRYAEPKLKTSMTKDQLKEAANFEPYKEPRATTGSTGAPRPGSGSPGGMNR